MSNHIITREGDETVCSCGRRWGADEEDPHPKDNGVSLGTRLQQQRSLRKLRSTHGLSRRRR